MQDGYTPDGWLGAMSGTMLYYKVFTDDLTQTDMKQLLKALGDSEQNGNTRQGKSYIIEGTFTDSSIMT